MSLRGLGVVVHAIILAMREVVQDGPGRRHKTLIKKQTKAKRA
jgi:hypothetical protein